MTSGVSTAASFSQGIAETYQSATPACGRESACPTLNVTPSEVRWSTHGSNHCELVGPLSTRSKPLQSASLPNNRIDQTDASPTSPIEWALASLDFDAARLRMIPSK